MLKIYTGAFVTPKLDVKLKHKEVTHSDTHKENMIKTIFSFNPAYTSTKTQVNVFNCKC